MEAASDRLWALTSKEEGTFEFDIQSLREYFAARFLYTVAGEEDPDFDRMEVLRELMRRPYWLNTARFYGGNANGGDTTAIAVGICDELANEQTRQTVVAAWTLLVDGIFNSRPKRAGEVLEALTTDSHIPVLLNALANSQVSPLPALPQDLEESATWSRLTQAIATTPADPKNAFRIDALRHLLPLGNEFDRWWRANLPHFAGTQHEKTWLRLGGRYESGNGHEDDASLAKVALANPGAALFLDTGLCPSTGSDLEKALVAKVLDGQCSGTRSIRSTPARIACVLSPEGFYTRSPSGFETQGSPTERRRAEAIRALDRTNSPFAGIAKKRRFGKGQNGSTFPWANTAAALHAQAGRCWLVSEIALIGAAHEHTYGATRIEDTTAFGPQSHPTTLLRETRNHAGDSAWWSDQFAAISAEDHLAQAEWAFALWAVATGPTIEALFADWERTVVALPAGRHDALIDAIIRMNGHHLLRKRLTNAKGTTHATNALLTGRNPEPAATRQRAAPTNAQATPGPLVATARAQKWLLVDTVARYE